MTVLVAVFDDVGSDEENLPLMTRKESMHALVIAFMSQQPGSNFPAFIDGLDHLSIYGMKLYTVNLF